MRAGPSPWWSPARSAWPLAAALCWGAAALRGGAAFAGPPPVPSRLAARWPAALAAHGAHGLTGGADVNAFRIKAARRCEAASERRVADEAETPKPGVPASAAEGREEGSGPESFSAGALRRFVERSAAWLAPVRVVPAQLR
ncbi:unnamed protein product [Prorocentrum cordatum]|uniref:Selenoprotein O n=1 Tax=Prorocentrum cordatum TaxID=2364126 RepID=A0ABN9PMI0_9DINO|nr:unnamed protein product [Polarella glacialis]